MSKTIGQVLDSADIARAVAAEADKAIKGLFMLFHGMYGNLFLSRYATGDVGADGKDKGVKSAMVVWQSDLARFDGEVIRAAAERCKTDHPKYPPTLPEFLLLCRALQPRRAHFDKPGAIAMSDGLKSSYTAKARAAAMASYRANLMAETGHMTVPDGAPGIGQLVAAAVGLAGGDEVATLLRIDKAMAPRGGR